MPPLLTTATLFATSLPFPPPSFLHSRSKASGEACQLFHPAFPIRAKDQASKIFCGKGRWGWTGRGVCGVVSILRAIEQWRIKGNLDDFHLSGRMEGRGISLNSGWREGRVKREVACGARRGKEWEEEEKDETMEIGIGGGYQEAWKGGREEEEYENFTSSTNVWDEKPAWCQPWTILTTGALAVGGSWEVLHWPILTALVTLFVALWWYTFLIAYPQAYANYITESRKRGFKE